MKQTLSSGKKVNNFSRHRNGPVVSSQWERQAGGQVIGWQCSESGIKISHYTIAIQREIQALLMLLTMHISIYIYTQRHNIVYIVEIRGLPGSTFLVLRLIKSSSGLYYICCFKLSQSCTEALSVVRRNLFFAKDVSRANK